MRTLIAGLTVSLLVLAQMHSTAAAPILAQPPPFPIIVASFDDSGEGDPSVDVVTSPADFLAGKIQIRTAPETGSVEIDGLLAEPIDEGVIKSFQLTDSKGLSDTIVFTARPPTDLIIGLFSDEDSQSFISFPPAYGSAAETGDFQFIPLPPGDDFPGLIALLFVRVRSDLEQLPEPASWLLLGTGILAFGVLRRAPWAR
jgi:PEP-CTERM motif